MKNWTSSNMEELEELQQEIVGRWAHNHKKSMISLLILIGLSQEPMWSKEIEKWLTNLTDWSFTERSLYRTLQRLFNAGLIEFTSDNAPKTGVDRKTYYLSSLGKKVAQGIRDDVLGYLDTPSFRKHLRQI